MCKCENVRMCKYNNDLKILTAHSQRICTFAHSHIYTFTKHARILHHITSYLF